MKAVAIDLDGALGDTRPLWEAWLWDAARRYRPIAALDPDSLPDDRVAAAADLDEWAKAGIGDWRRALERFAEDRAPVYLRPNPRANAALRQLHLAGTRVGVFSDAPSELARVALVQLGVARRITALETGAGSLERLVERLGPDTTIVRAAEELEALP